MAAQDAPGVPRPVSGPAPTTVSLVAGGLVSLGGGATAGARPLASVAADFALTNHRLGPRGAVVLDLTALPGEAIDVARPETFRAVAFRVLLLQPISGLRVMPYLGLGFATRIEADPKPLERTARWWSGGLRLAGARGSLELGLGQDQRLGSDYQPTAHARGTLLLGDRGGINAWLIGEAILGLRLGYSAEGRVDVVTIGVGAGR